ncbi:MAG: 5,10-methylene tetrahydromethanopterin reductase, partial [Actinomycetia bacterium]|nr:5,10-methylene tetrahydromethanopterin reductase [Actinomycetes bacterium]
AAAAGRARPRVVSIVQCALAAPDRNPVRLASMGCGQHIRLPHYASMLRKAGIDITGSPASDLRAALRSGLFAYGSAHEIAAIVNSYFRAGVDEVVLNVGSVGLEHGNTAALDDVEEILDAVGQIRTEQFTSTGR